MVGTDTFPLLLQSPKSLEPFKRLKKRLGKSTHNDTVLAYVDIGANLGCIDNTVLLYEDMITNVERKESNPATGESFIQMVQHIN